jgi:hypothetical protein
VKESDYFNLALRSEKFSSLTLILKSKASVRDFIMSGFSLDSTTLGYSADLPQIEESLETRLISSDSFCQLR